MTVNSNVLAAIGPRSLKMICLHYLLVMYMCINEHRHRKLVMKGFIWHFCGINAQTSKYGEDLTRSYVRIWCSKEGECLVMSVMSKTDFTDWCLTLPWNVSTIFIILSVTIRTSWVNLVTLTEYFPQKCTPEEDLSRNS